MTLRPLLPALLPTLLVFLAACASAPVTDREPDEGAEHEPLLADAGIAHVVVPEAFVTASTPADNIDSPASWLAPDGGRWLLATAKATDLLIVYDGASGARLRTVGGPGAGPGQLQRPNGIAVVEDPGAGAGHALALVVERDNHRVQAFALPALESVAIFGSEDLVQPYGLWVRPLDGAFEVIVSDNYMSSQDEDLPPPDVELDRRFKRYRLRRDGGAWSADLLGSFGETGEGAIRIAESVFGDISNDRLLLAEEDVASGTRLREYGLDGRYRGRDIGAGLFKAQAEGLALWRCGNDGYWIATDQFKDRSLFHIFDRDTLAHVGAFAGERTANTDGIWLDQAPDARFPEGVFYAVDDDQAVAAFDWRDVAKALGLQETCKTP
ncbi:MULTISPECIES: phytase [unclassified Lysobacter]|uniref:phytase n=1 Tax=unclassified Lysobacter TaxID=2635362 RepID=UPI001F575CBD|nr:MULTISPECIES: phytase [unclassified Lysobacter]